MRSGLTLCRALAIAALTLFPALRPVALHAENRVALVIGNNRYPNLAAEQQLAKAVNDANAMGDALERIGFTVIRGLNLDRQGMVDRLFEFTKKIAPGDTALLFYAGHGVAIAGGNYLLPSDVRIAGVGEESRVRNMAIGEADMVADIQERKPRVAVLVLDACRDNPFRQPGVTRSLGGERGLARGDEAQGVFAIYSAGFGQSALDNLGPNDPSPNSVFTRILVPALAHTDTHLADLVIDVREQVAKLAASVNHQQSPAYYDQTSGGRIYLAARPAAMPPMVVGPPTFAPPPAPVDRLGRVWQEEEGDGWKGVWSRRGATSKYDASWAHPQGKRDSATLDVAVNGDTVAIARISINGNPCAYQGGFLPDGSVGGTYGCASKNTATWKASINGATANDRMGWIWREEESGWSGLWTRRGDSTTFDANWTHPNGGKVAATLVVSVGNNSVMIARTEANGSHCQYEGTPSPDGSTVTGTYRCVDKDTPIWKASIEGATAGDRLGRAWREEESGWSGAWTRRGNSWTFDANWTHPSGGKVAATLVMSVSGNAVSITRTDSNGSHCQYAGTLAPDGQTVAGTYGCDGVNTGWKWRASIGP
jgi:hypothetical protein